MKFVVGSLKFNQSSTDQRLSTKAIPVLAVSSCLRVLPEPDSCVVETRHLKATLRGEQAKALQTAGCGSNIYEKQLRAKTLLPSSTVAAW
jgi:hypothetical protein